MITMISTKNQETRIVTHKRLRKGCREGPRFFGVATEGLRVFVVTQQWK